MEAKHNIQKQILTRLMANPNGCRYRDMKPEDIENDLYNYHLQFLVRQGFVEKVETQYRLSDAGQRYILDIQPMDVTGLVADKFKLAALALALRKTDQGLEVLYQTRGYHPSAGTQQIIGGSIRKGELVTDAAKRRLHEEAGLVAEFTFLGTIRKIRQEQTGAPYSDITYHICFATNPTGQLVEKNIFGNHQWVPLARLITDEQQNDLGCSRFATVLTKLLHAPETIPGQFYFEEIYSML